MSVHRIAITTAGITLAQHVNHGDKVCWQANPNANGTYPLWNIIFFTNDLNNAGDPFREHVIATDPDTGQTDFFTVRNTPRAHHRYIVSSLPDPTSAQVANLSKKKGEKGSILIPGGGIIIDA